MLQRNAHFIGMVILFAVFLSSCIQNQEKTSSIEKNTLAAENLALDNQVADTIIYDVIIRNINPEDTWAEESLKGLQHKKLIDSLFTLIYSKESKAYEYFTDEALSLDDMKKLEKEAWFNRKHIGKIQFVEKWYFNNSSQSFQKQVISLSLGHELYSDQGEFRGYKPVFKIYMQP